MFSPYYSPNISFVDIFKSLFNKNSCKKLVHYFKEYTGKNYILITSSCRSALYLAYKSIDKKGQVITSPLTCKSAIDPIIWSGNIPVFTDISLDTLNMNEEQVEKLIFPETIAVQMINHGGILVDQEKIIQSTKGKNVVIIEDCAQSFGSTFRNKRPNFNSDIICFSLIKNAYGIGGGILATNSKSVYEKALKYQQKFKKFSGFVILYRLFYSFLETYQKNCFARRLLEIIKKIKLFKKKDHITVEKEKNKYLRKPHKYFCKLFSSRVIKINSLRQARIKNGVKFFEKLKEHQLAFNYKNIKLSDSSFTKLFVYNPQFNGSNLIKKLNQKNIQAKHLEQRDDARLQPAFLSLEEFKDSFKLECYNNYKQIHNSLLALPLTEKMQDNEMNYIINEIKKHINENNLV